VTLLIPQGENARFALAGLTLGGFAFSAYLTYREIFSIHAICEECASSAVVMTIMMCLAVWRFLRGEAPPGSAAASAAGQSAAPDSAAPLSSAS
jgi:uncharacterized membrane protein